VSDVPPATVVRGLFESMQARAWDAARALVDETATIHWPVTQERFDGDAYVEMNRSYPDGWTITICDVLAADDRVAARVRVDHGDDLFWCAGYYTVTDGRIADGVELWCTEGSEPAPAWRAPFRRA
jgi:hypothetical protein